MINGLVVGIVVDNVDPDKMGRIKVNFPVDAETPPDSTWVRMLTPMAGKLRGLVMIPEVGTEVVLGFSHRTMSPYVMGAVYNGGADKPKPYANEDGNDDHRRFWSRNSHWIDFDDTAGKERIEIKATSENEAIYQELHAANKVITQKVGKNIVHEAVETVSFKCKDFKVDATASIAMSASQTAVLAAKASAKVETRMQTFKASKVDINGGSPGTPKSVLPTPTHKHPPTKPGGAGAGGAAAGGGGAGGSGGGAGGAGGSSGGSGGSSGSGGGAGSGDAALEVSVTIGSGGGSGSGGGGSAGGGGNSSGGSGGSSGGGGGSSGGGGRGGGGSSGGGGGSGGGRGGESSGRGGEGSGRGGEGSGGGGGSVADSEDPGLGSHSGGFGSSGGSDGSPSHGSGGTSPHATPDTALGHGGASPSGGGPDQADAPKVGGAKENAGAGPGAAGSGGGGRPPILDPFSPKTGEVDARRAERFGDERETASDTSRERTSGPSTGGDKPASGSSSGPSIDILKRLERLKKGSDDAT